MGDQAAMAAQLLLGQLAGEPGPAIEQPGQAMHDPRGGAQRLAPGLDAGQILVVTGRLIGLLLAQLPEALTGIIGQREGLGIKRFDNAGIGAG
jgi:hypothetical protein